MSWTLVRTALLILPLLGAPARADEAAPVVTTAAKAPWIDRMHEGVYNAIWRR